jgi:hypothetical protein
VSTGDCVYECMYECKSACLYGCMHVRVYVCMYIRMYICALTCGRMAERTQRQHSLLSFVSQFEMSKEHLEHIDGTCVCLHAGA